jgi:hypothetical protein
MKKRRFILTIEKVDGSKVNVWVPTADTEIFRNLMNKHGLTATEQSPSRIETRFIFEAKVIVVNKLLEEYNAVE